MADAVVPERFADAIDQHLVFNFAAVRAWPLVLGIFGRPGDGKSFQLRAQLDRRRVSVVSINAADLESDRAGAPGKLVLEMYESAGHRADEDSPAALVVDDFDTTVGEWEHSTTTVNHQQVLAQLMHLADSPQEAAGKTLRRVPVFITGPTTGENASLSLAADCRRAKRDRVRDSRRFPRASCGAEIA
jgi:SpoVK/Ycf46/Vps4 family AAA+-type ATPase